MPEDTTRMVAERVGVSLSELVDLVESAPDDRPWRTQAACVGSIRPSAVPSGARPAGRPRGSVLPAQLQPGASPTRSGNTRSLASSAARRGRNGERSAGPLWQCDRNDGASLRSTGASLQIRGFQGSWAGMVR